LTDCLWQDKAEASELRIRSKNYCTYNSYHCGGRDQTHALLRLVARSRRRYY